MSDRAITVAPTSAPFRGPFTRWPRAADAILALVVFLGGFIDAAVQETGGSPELDVGLVSLPLIAWGLLLVTGAVVYWRRRQPVAVLAVTLVVILIWAGAGYPGDPTISLLVAIYSVGRYADNLALSSAVVATTLLLVVVGEFLDGEPIGIIGTAVFFTFLPWYVGRRLGIRNEYLEVLRERAEHLEREREAEAQRVIVEERARIARELHDVVAHRVSMMTVQAGAASPGFS